MTKRALLQLLYKLYCNFLDLAAAGCGDREDAMIEEVRRALRSEGVIK